MPGSRMRGDAHMELPMFHVGTVIHMSRLIRSCVQSPDAFPPLDLLGLNPHYRPR